MRVAHVITRLIVGGAQENTIATVTGLHRKPDCAVTLISGPSPGAEGSLEPSVRAAGLDLEVFPSLVRPVHPWKDFFALRELTAHFCAQRPDIVHTHSGKAGVLGRLAAARAGVPIIIHTIHGPSFGNFQGTLANWIFTAAERRAAQVTTHFVSVADEMSRQYLAAGIGAPAQFTTIRSGFELTPFLHASNDSKLRAQLGLQPGDIVVGKIARLFRLKGHDDLLAVAPELIQAEPRLQFLFLGDGPWRQRLEQRARETGVAGHIKFVGLVPPTEVARYVGIMDFLVHLSYREGLPRALPQALAAARPVIAYDCDGAREVCLDGKTGCLIPAGKLAPLKQAVLKLATDSDLRARLGASGQQLVQDQFPTQKMVDHIFALYQRLLTGGKQS
ncbi:MAG: Spore coat protein [Verrucomicrobiota bacterium]|jgi:glycosyltransferase involved in cell wall biosynthesis